MRCAPARAPAGQAGDHRAGQLVLGPARRRRRGARARPRPRRGAPAAARDRAAQLSEFGVDTVLLVDEPALGRVPEPPAEVWEPLRGAAATWGLRVGGAVPWPLVRELDPDLVALGLDGGDLELAAARALGALCERGARVMWRVPLAGGGHAAAARLERAVALVAGATGADADLLRERSLVAPAGPAGPVSAATEDAAVAAVSAAALLQRWAGGGDRLRHPPRR